MVDAGSVCVSSLAWAGPAGSDDRAPLREVPRTTYHPRPMWLDLLVLVAVLGFAWTGWRSGALLMALRLVALGLAAYTGARGAMLLGEQAASLLDLSSMGGAAAAFTAVFVVSLIALRLLARLVARLLAPSGTIVGGFDRILGAVVGGATAGLACWIGVSGLVILSARLGGSPPTLNLSGSVTADLAGRNSFFQFLPLPRAETLRSVARAAARIASGQAPPGEDASRLAAYASLARHPKASFLEDPTIVQALLDGDWGTVLSDARVWSFLADEEVARRLATLDGLPDLPPKP